MSDSTMMVINSTINTTVFKDVSHIDRTISIEKAKAIMVTGNANLINITPTWHNVKCRIVVGTSTVPAELKEWKSFKALVRKGLVTLVDSRLTEEIKNGVDFKAKEEELARKEAELARKEAELNAKTSTKPSQTKPTVAKNSVENLVAGFDPKKGADKE